MPKDIKSSSQKTHLLLGILYASVSGCLVFLSFPKFNLFPLQWFSLVPLIIACRGRSLKGGVFLGFIAGFVTNLGGFYWVSVVLKDFGHMKDAPAWALTCLLCSYQALPMAFTCGFSARLATRYHKVLWFLAFPIIYTGFEWLVPFVFPWFFANGQGYFHAITQIVEIFGVSGLTFLLVFVNSAIAYCVLLKLEGRSLSPWGIVVIIMAGALFFASLVYGLKRIPEVDELVSKSQKIKLGVVEANIGIFEKEAKNKDGTEMDYKDKVRLLYKNLLKHQIMSAQLEREHKVNLIIWPESSYWPVTRVLSRERWEDFALVTGQRNILMVSADKHTETLETPESVQINAVAFQDEKHGVGVGAKGAVFIYDGNEWHRETTGIDRDLFAVSYLHHNIFVGGAQGVLAVWDEGKWKPLESKTNSTIRAMASLSERKVIAVGDNGTIIVLPQINIIPSSTQEDLVAVTSAKGKAVAVGKKGVVLEIEGMRVAQMPFPFEADLKAVAIAKENVFLLSEKGVLFRCSSGVCSEVKGIAPLELVASDGFETVLGIGQKKVFRLREDGVLPVFDIETLRSPRSLTYIPYSEGYPWSKDVRRIYVSREPLPSGSLGEIEKLVDADAQTPVEDRNAVRRGFKAPLIFGAITTDGEHDYNSAHLIDSDGRVLGTYHKNYLLIFGEFLPFSNIFPFLKKWFPEAGDLTPGDSVTSFSLDGKAIGVMICYEDIIPQFTRKVASLKPHLLVNITNDAWFGKTSEPYEHLLLATFRAIENRLFLIRSTNTGVSAVIDPVGRILKETDLDNPETIVAEVALLQTETPYQRYRDIFAWACSLLTLLFVVASFFRSKKA